MRRSAADRGRACAGLVGRGRRLCRQAVLGPRAHGAGAGAAPAQPARADRRPPLRRDDLDRETRRVRRAGRDIHLGPTEFRLLEYLLEKPGRAFSRALLLDGVWGQASEIDKRTVDVHVGRLRKALSRGRERDPIRTVRGTGYAFDETFGKV